MDDEPFIILHRVAVEFEDGERAEIVSTDPRIWLENRRAYGGRADDVERLVYSTAVLPKEAWTDEAYYDPMRLTTTDARSGAVSALPVW